MKKLQSVVCFALIVILQGSSCTGGSSLISAIAGKKMLDDLMADVNIAIESAVTGGDYLLEKNARTMDVMARNYLIQLQEETRTNRDFISNELSGNITMRFDTARRRGIC